MSTTITDLREQWHYRGNQRPAFARVPEPGQESVWDYPRPPALVRDLRKVVVRTGNQVLAESRRTYRLLETAGAPCFYIAPDDVDQSQLVKNSRTTFCEWKGTAAYFDLVSGSEDVAWTYPEPFADFQEICGWFAFYPSKVICEVGGAVATPQAGGFYGGWVTPDVVGPFKGDPEAIDLRKTHP